MKKSFALVMLLLFVFFNQGCILDEWLGQTDIEPVPVNIEHVTIDGTVMVPAEGASKIVGKLVYKAAPTTTKVYLLLSSLSWSKKMDFKNNFTAVMVIDSDGRYEFNKAVKGEKYCIIVDINDDGKCDDMENEIIAGTDNTTNIAHYVRETNSNLTLLVSVKTNKQEYLVDENVQLAVTGYALSAQTLHIEVWDESNNGKYVWASETFNVEEGEISENVEFKIPVGWSSTSKGADYKVYVALGHKLLSCSVFTITGENTGDSTNPTKGTLLINSGKEMTNNPAVQLTISSPDADAQKMIISNISGDYSNSTWETIRSLKDWTLVPDEGEKTVYIKFIDDSGNTSEEFSDTIILTSAPLASTVVSVEKISPYEKIQQVVVIFDQKMDLSVTPVITLSGTHWGLQDNSIGWSSQSDFSDKFTAVFTHDGTEEEIAQAKATVSSARNINGKEQEICHSPPFTIHTIPPKLTTVSIVSDYTSPSMAGPGMTVTISITADQALTGITVTLDGNPADTLVQGTNTSQWSATRIIQPTDTDGSIAFTIDFTGQFNKGFQMVNTTDGSSVVLDTTPPSIVEAHYLDTDHDLAWDYIEIKFSEPVKDSSIYSSLYLMTSQRHWTILDNDSGDDVVGYRGQTDTTSVSGGMDADIDDEYYSILFVTGMKPSGDIPLYYTGAGGVTDLMGNLLPAVVDFPVLDKIPPVLLSVKIYGSDRLVKQHWDTAGDSLYLTYSEDVKLGANVNYCIRYTLQRGLDGGETLIYGNQVSVVATVGDTVRVSHNGIDEITTINQGDVMLSNPGFGQYNITDLSGNLLFGTNVTVNATE
ncbi:hypothetical protein KAJ27_11360 [bacterium]|nr:hypothetical protein [bacterium]